MVKWSIDIVEVRQRDWPFFDHGCVLFSWARHTIDWVKAIPYVMRGIPLLIDFLIQIPELDPEYPSRSYPRLPFPYMHKNISMDQLKV